MLVKSLGFSSQQLLVTVSHLLLARMEPFPQTAVVLSPGKYRALLLTLKTWVSAVWLFSPTPALLIVSSRTAELVWVHKRQQVLPGCGDKSQASWVIQEAPPRVTWGLASGGGCPLAQSAGMCLGARLLEGGWIYRLSTKVLELPKVSTTFSLLLAFRGGCLGVKLLLGASSCSGNSQQQADESVQPPACLVLVANHLPPGNAAGAAAHCCSSPHMPVPVHALSGGCCGRG